MTRSVARLKVETKAPSLYFSQLGRLGATADMATAQYLTRQNRGRSIHSSAAKQTSGRTTTVVVLILAVVVIAILVWQPWRQDSLVSHEEANTVTKVAVAKNTAEAVVTDDKESQPTVQVRVEPRHNFTLPLNNPPYVTGSQADFMKPDDYVVGVIQRGIKRAYPWVALANHHIVHDTIGGGNVFIAHCEVCSGAAAFDSTVSLRGRQVGLTFRMGGIGRGTWIARDVMTNSLWSTFAGQATSGSLAGKRLKRLRTYTTTWGQWYSSHPETQIVYLSEEMRRRPHGMGHSPGDRSVYPTWHQQQFRSRLEESEKLRWRDPSELVFGLFNVQDRSAVAYPLAEMDATGTGRMRQVTLGDQKVILVVTADAQGLVVAAYHGNANGQSLELSLTESESLQMRDANANLWNFWGECIAGVNQGSQLRPANGYLTKWFEWVESFPDTELEGKKLRLSVADALQLARTKPASEAFTPWRD